MRKIGQIIYEKKDENENNIIPKNNIVPKTNIFEGKYIYRLGI